MAGPNHPPQGVPLRGRRVLITAGPTWVRIDAVRHISNFSSGRTGITLATTFARAGAEVTLLLGPVQVPAEELRASGIRVLPFVTFDDLHGLVREQLRTGAFHAMLHAAAVSDYRPISEVATKLPSGDEELILRLRPTPKIVDEIKDLAADLVLVKFKLEVARTQEELFGIARSSASRSRADLVVANDLSEYHDGRHRAFVLDSENVLAECETTQGLADSLVTLLTERLDAPVFGSVRPVV